MSNKLKSITVAAPGRINILGEHTDYNGGYVLPAAINLTTTFKLTKNNTEGKANVIAHNVDSQHTFDLDNFKPIDGTWQNYVMGVVHELQELGGKISGFDAEFNGTVPIGSGMSSSAALECSLAYGLNVLFDLGFDDWQLIKASQMAEHNFVGIKCGIMDQFASVMGRADHAMLLDCQSLEFEYVPLEMGDYHFLLLDTNVSHALANSEYNKRREECEEGLSILKKNYEEVVSLRDVSLEMLNEVRAKMPEIVWNRCLHVVSENDRVMKAVAALRGGALSELGQLMYGSHQSLSKLYEVSCSELDFLAELSENESAILGSRMMGGGFGGSTINLITKEDSEEVIARMSKAYADEYGKELTAYVVTTGAGAREL